MLEISFEISFASAPNMCVEVHNKVDAVILGTIGVGGGQLCVWTRPKRRATPASTSAACAECNETHHVAR